jgi:hypothetical protein
MSSHYKDLLIKKILFTRYDKLDHNPKILDQVYKEGIYNDKTIKDLEEELNYLNNHRS